MGDVMNWKEKVGTGVGATAGTGGGICASICAISALGVEGLSGAGILSGLATIGGTVVGGIVVVAGATVFVAGATAYGGYKAATWMNK